MLVEILANIKHRQVFHFHNRVSPTTFTNKLFLQSILTLKNGIIALTFT